MAETLGQLLSVFDCACSSRLTWAYGPVLAAVHSVGGLFATDYRLIWSSYVELPEPARPECYNHQRRL
jgi:hypothetical protein